MRFGSRLAKEEIVRRKFERREKHLTKLKKCIFSLLAGIDKARLQLYCWDWKLGVQPVVRRDLDHLKTHRTFRKVENM